MRSNPGGLLTSAVEVASDFLDANQLVVYTEGTSPRDDLLARPGQKQKHYPLIVLVNGGSASGSEIVAAAIKDHGRGLVLGRKTFGKASVQKVVQLSGDHAMKLTVAHYYSPSGVNIHKIGIAPDIETPWFSQSENKILTKLRRHEKIKAFIEENGDDVLTKLDAARQRISRGSRCYRAVEEISATRGCVVQRGACPQQCRDKSCHRARNRK